jgi:hypothetical protein
MQSENVFILQVIQVHVYYFKKTVHVRVFKKVMKYLNFTIFFFHILLFIHDETSISQEKFTLI